MGNNLLLYGILAVGGYIWWTRFNGKATVDGLLNQVKGQFNSGQNVSGSWTDDKGNNYNFDNGKNMQINRQSNVGTGGSIKQEQTHHQTSSVLYTSIKLGNLR